jgi:hypothetical protein
MKRQMDVSQLNKRQYFAALMLAAIVENDGMENCKNIEEYKIASKAMAKGAVCLADALIEELNKEEND